MKKKGKLVRTIVLILTLLLTGCGIVDEKDFGETPISQENEKEMKNYYTVEEIALPNPDKDIKEIIGEEKIATLDPVLHGDNIYRVVILFDENGNHKEYYLQILNLSDMEWKNISESKETMIDGDTYTGFDDPIYAENGKVYSVTYQAEEDKYYLCTLGESGIDKIIASVPEELVSGGYNSKLTCDKSDRFYYLQKADYSSWENTISFLDGLFQTQHKVSYSGRMYDIVQADAQSDVYWYGLNEDEKVTIRRVTDNEILLDGYEEISDDYQVEFNSSGSLFLADKQAIWNMDGELKSVFNFIQNDYIVDALYSMEAGQEGEMQLLVKLDGDYTLLKLKESDAPMTTQKQEIVIAFAMAHPALNKEIVRFNKQNNEYHVSILLPDEDEDWASFRNRIQLEIGAGKGPDILGHDVILDVIPFVKNNYLECLDDLITSESDYLYGALEGCRVEGKLYGIPYDCSFSFAAYSEDFTKGKTSWTVPEMMEAVKSSDAKILQKGCSGVGIILRYGLYDNSNTTYIDWEKGKSHLAEEPFLELLSFAKEYADTGSVQGEEGTLIESGEAFAVEVSFDELHLINYLTACFQGKAAIIGYPRKEGNGIYVSSRDLYVNSMSDCKEGAKEFLRYLISEEVQVKYSKYDRMAEIEGGGTLWGYKGQFPVHMGAFDEVIDKAKDTNKEEFRYYDNDVIYDGTPYTDKEMGQFLFLLENAQPGTYKVSNIQSIVSEELEPYFAGDITAEQATEKLHNRVQLYLNEQVK